MKYSYRIDCSKIIFCICVLFIHTHNTLADISVEGGDLEKTVSDFISKVISDCAVPGFTILSSYLLYVKKDFDWRQNIHKKIQSLLVPYFIFNTLWIIVDFVRTYFFHLNGGNKYLEYNILDWLNSYLGLYNATDWKPVLTPLWFIRDLFILNIIALPVKRVIDKLPIICFILSICLWITGIKIPFVHSYVLVFFVFGYYLVEYDFKIGSLDRINLLSFILVYAAVAVADLLSGFVPLHRIFIIISILFVIRCSKYLCSSSRSENIMQALAPATLLIYLIHPFIYVGINMLVDKDSLLEAYIFYFTKPLIAFAIGIGLYYLLSFYSPALLRVIVGGRSIKTLTIYDRTKKHLR